MRFSLLVAVACFGVAAAGCATQPSSAQTRAGGPAPTSVSTVRVDCTPLVRTITGNGTLAAEEEVMLSLKVTGRLDELRVDSARRVHRGEIIARLSPTDFELRVQQATAALQQARARLGLPPQGEATRSPSTTVVTRAPGAGGARRVAPAARSHVQTFVTRGISPKAELSTPPTPTCRGRGPVSGRFEELRNRQAVLAQRRSEAGARPSAARRRGAAVAHRRRGALAHGGGRRVPRRRHADRHGGAAGSAAAAAGGAGTQRRRRARWPGGARDRARARDEVLEGRVVRLSPSIAEGTRTLAIEARCRRRAQLRPGSFARADIVVSEAAGLWCRSRRWSVFAGVEKVMTVKDGAAPRAAHPDRHPRRRAGGGVEGLTQGDDGDRHRATASPMAPP